MHIFKMLYKSSAFVFIHIEFSKLNLEMMNAFEHLELQDSLQTAVPTKGH